MAWAGDDAVSPHAIAPDARTRLSAFLPMIRPHLSAEIAHNFLTITGHSQGHYPGLTQLGLSGRPATPWPRVVMTGLSTASGSPVRKLSRLRGQLRSQPSYRSRAHVDWRSPRPDGCRRLAHAPPRPEPEPALLPAASNPDRQIDPRVRMCRRTGPTTRSRLCGHQQPRLWFGLASQRGRTTQEPLDGRAGSPGHARWTVTTDETPPAARACHQRWRRECSSASPCEFWLTSRTATTELCGHSRKARSNCWRRSGSTIALISMILPPEIVNPMRATGCSPTITTTPAAPLTSTGRFGAPGCAIESV